MNRTIALIPYARSARPIPTAVSVCADCGRRHQFITRRCSVCGCRCVPESVVLAEAQERVRAREYHGEHLERLAKGGMP